MVTVFQSGNGTSVNCAVQARDAGIARKQDDEYEFDDVRSAGVGDIGESGVHLTGSTARISDEEWTALIEYAISQDGVDLVPESTIHSPQPSGDGVRIQMTPVAPYLGIEQGDTVSRLTADGLLLIYPSHQRSPIEPTALIEYRRQQVAQDTARPDMDEPVEELTA